MSEPSCFFTSAYKSRYPNLPVGMIGIAFTISAIQSRTNAFHLKNAHNHVGDIQSSNHSVAFLIDVWSNSVSNLSSVATEGDAAVEGG